MKKLLLFACICAFSFTASSQIIFEDDFESYTAGDYVATQSTVWTTWTGSPGSAEDAFVSSDYAAMGVNSMKFEGTSVDMVYPFDDLTSGAYDIEFYMYIPTGNGGYMNLLHDWAPDDTQYEWSIDVYFDAAGDITWTTEGATGGAGSFTHDTWFHMKMSVDLDNDLGQLFVGTDEVHSWQFSIINNTGLPGLNQLSGWDIFGTTPDNSPPLFYIDEVVITQTAEPTNIEDLDLIEANFYPNPAVDRLNVTLENTSGTTQMSIVDMTGKLVLSEQLNSNQEWVNTESLVEGLYLVYLTNGKRTLVKKLVITK